MHYLYFAIRVLITICSLRILVHPLNNDQTWPFYTHRQSLDINHLPAINTITRLYGQLMATQEHNLMLPHPHNIKPHGNERLLPANIAESVR
jgi:hypothetical protein